MKTKTCSENQILDVLAKEEAGTSISEVARQSGIAKATVHRWKARYGGMSRDDAKQVRYLKEDRRLRKLVADLTLDNSM